jgi:vitamin B12 transporter
LKYFIIALAGLSLTGLCLAAYADALDNDPLETITVTASRTPVALGDTGSSVSIISKEQILRRNTGSLADLLREIPGMAVSQQGSSGAITQVRVRGAEANQVLVLIDGVEANDLSQGSEFNFTHLMANQIERIEIVRGPQSAIWGSDALSGVINIITRPVDQTGARITGYAQGGSFNTTKSGFGVQYGSARNQVKFSADYLDTQGTNISRSGSEKDGYENTTVNLSGTYHASDNFQLSYLVRNTESTTDFDDIDFISTGLPTDAAFFTDSSQTYAGLSLSYNLKAWSHTLSYTKSRTENITSTSAPVDDESRGDKNQVRYQANLALEHHIITGMLEYEQEDFAQRGAASFFGDPNKNLDTDTKSVALEYRYDGEFLDLSLSGRRDRNSEFDNGRSWRTTAAWHLVNDSTSLFASVGESVKNPTFTERFGFFDTFTGNPDLQPEASFSWELGLRQSLIDKRLVVTATWFDASLDNEINGFVFDFSSGTFSAANAAGESSRQGFELGLDYNATEYLSMAAGYTYLDATQENTTGSDITEVRRPKNSGSVSVNLKFSKANLNIAVSHTGNQEDDFFPPFPPFQQRVNLPGFTLLNLSGTFQLNPNVELTLRIENALDEKYEQVFGFSSPGVSAYGGVRVTW